MQARFEVKGTAEQPWSPLAISPGMLEANKYRSVDWCRKTCIGCCKHSQQGGPEGAIILLLLGRTGSVGMAVYLGTCLGSRPSSSTLDGCWMSV